MKKKQYMKPQAEIIISTEFPCFLAGQKMKNIFQIQDRLQPKRISGTLTMRKTIAGMVSLVSVVPQISCGMYHETFDLYYNPRQDCRVRLKPYRSCLGNT